MPYCSYGPWLSSHAPKFLAILDRICIKGDEIRCNTLICPNAELVGKLSKMLENKTERRNALKICNSLQLQIDLHDKKFMPGTYKNNLGQGVQISSPSNDTFEIKSGKGFATIAKVKLNKTFDPDLQFRSDEDRHMCVVDIVSGEIAIDGDPHMAAQPIRPIKGSSEFTTNGNPRLEAWNAIVNSIRFELKHKTSLDEPLARLCGIMKLLLKKKDEIVEYEKEGKIIRTAICYEPLASLYVLMQPYGTNPILSTRFDKEWSFAPYIPSDTHALYAEFYDAFPCGIDHDAKSTIVSELKTAAGIGKVDELQDAYRDNCEKLFGSIGFPCGQKLWADEVCFYICHRMSEIRKNHDVGAFDKLCSNLAGLYPGVDHKKESKFGSEDYWNSFDMSNEVKNIEGFINSFCCLQCCPDEMSNTYKERCVHSLTPSNFTKVFLYLNQ
jgi:hypothetical protein